jgi:Domain of unknown function (DUF4397)
MTLPARAFRIAKPLAVLGLSLGLLCYAVPAASAAPAAHATSASKGIGWLRLAHLSPNTPPVDVYLYPFGNAHAMIVLKHVAYGTVSGYQSVKSGDYTVAMRSAGAGASSKPVLSTSVDVTAGDAYTVAGMGPLSGLRLQVMQDRLTTPPRKALVRVIQASLQQHQVTVTAGKQVLAGKEAFARVSSYQVVSPGRWNVRAAGATESAASKVTLAAGSIHTFVVLDHPGHLWITSLEDAAGSRVFPAGGAATGFGGTAARAGSSPAPWLVTMAAGMLLALAGAARLRRPRRTALVARGRVR